MLSRYLKRFKLIFSDLNNDYKFSFKDRLLACRIFFDGYGKDQQKEELINSCVNDNSGFQFDYLRIKKNNFYVVKNNFKPGELAYLFSEVFIPDSKNPHSYEKDFIKIEKGDVVIDAGSCEGFFTKYALDKGAGKIYSFEPFENFKMGLEKTFDQEIKNEIIEVVPKALSGICGQFKFSVDKEYLCEAQLSDKGSIDVQTITIDFFVKQNNLKKLDFIKMDIEGEEVNAIKGALETIKNLKPKMSIAVYHKYENAKLIKDLILNVCPEYKIKFGGCFMYERPYRPYMLYAYL